LDDAQKSIEKFHAVLPSEVLEQPLGEVDEKVLECLASDLNFAKALSVLHETAKSLKANRNETALQNFAATLDFLGLLTKRHVATAQNKTCEANEIDENFINSQIALRLKFKQEKNFQKADEIRQNLLLQGIVLEDQKGQTLWKKA
jgi:cysteinyl-tRNA synthetase